MPRARPPSLAKSVAPGQPKTLSGVASTQLQKAESRGATAESLALERYRGVLRRTTPEGKPLLNERGEQLTTYTPESRAEGCLAFMREVTRFQPRGYQEEAVRRLYKRRRLAVCGPRGLGKSAFDANVILHFLAVNPICKVIATAGSKDQLKFFLWPEIEIWSDRADWSMVGFTPPTINEADIYFPGRSSARASAVKPDISGLIEGGHAPCLLALIDEAKSSTPEIFDALEGSVAKGDKYFLATSTPGAESGRFYSIMQQLPEYQDWDTMQVTQDQILAALLIENKLEHRTQKEWCEARLRQWGPENPLYRNQVLGEFANTDESSLIPSTWIEAAMQRHDDWEEAGSPLTEEWVGDLTTRNIGVDVAGQGKDATVIARRVGRCVTSLEKHAQIEPEELAELLARICTEYINLNLEVDGPGAEVLRYVEKFLEAQDNAGVKTYNEVEIVQIYSGGKTAKTEFDLRFADPRSWMWWNMKNLLNPENGFNIMLPRDTDLKKELNLPRWELNGLVIKIESKKTIKSRNLHKSTDTADAVVFSMSTDPGDAFQPSMQVSATADRMSPTGRIIPGSVYDRNGYSGGRAQLILQESGLTRPWGPAGYEGW